MSYISCYGTLRAAQKANYRERGEHRDCRGTVPFARQKMENANKSIRVQMSMSRARQSSCRSNPTNSEWCLGHFASSIVLSAIAWVLNAAETMVCWRGLSGGAAAYESGPGGSMVPSGCGEQARADAHRPRMPVWRAAAPPRDRSQRAARPARRHRSRCHR